MDSRRKGIALYLFSLFFVFSFLFSASGNGSQDNQGSSEILIMPQGIKGDIDTNGRVDIFDLLAILKTLGGAEEPTAESDVNYNGETDIFDLLELLKVLAGGAVTPGDTTVVQGITMVSIPAGSFQMGSDTGFPDERPVHTVILDAFQMSKYEITQAQYQGVIGTNPSFFTGDNNRPVEQVSWYAAVAFCNKLSALAGLDSCYTRVDIPDEGGDEEAGGEEEELWECDFSKNGFRLPTEAEWEYACRAGTVTEYYTGDEESALEIAGWYEENSGGATYPSGQKEPNAWGLYDMSGNVWEWCHDWCEAGYYSESPASNPRGPETGITSIRRGGSWFTNELSCRSSNRGNAPPDCKSPTIGFRVVRR